MKAGRCPAAARPLTYPYGVASSTARIRIAKDPEEARHGLQTGQDGRVEAVLHVGDGDEATYRQAFAVGPEGRLWQVYT